MIAEAELFQFRQLELLAWRIVLVVAVDGHDAEGAILKGYDEGETAVGRVLLGAALGLQAVDRAVAEERRPRVRRAFKRNSELGAHQAVGTIGAQHVAADNELFATILMAQLCGNAMLVLDERGQRDAAFHRHTLAFQSLFERLFRIGLGNDQNERKACSYAEQRSAHWLAHVGAEVDAWRGITRSHVVVCNAENVEKLEGAGV